MSQDMCVPCGEGIINIRVGAIILKDDRFLMVRNNAADYFYSVGGRVQFGETAEEAVIREVCEETGIRMEIDHLGFVQENYFIGDTPSRLGKVYYELCFYFYMKTPAEFEPVCESFTEEGQEERLEWVSPDDPRTIFPAFFRTDLSVHEKSVKHMVCDDRFYIRKMVRDDLDRLQILLSDPVAMKYLEPPFIFEKTQDFLESHGLVSDPGVLAVEDSMHQLIGYVIYHDYDESGKEIGWVLMQSSWGRGIASLLTKQLIAMAASEGRDTVIEFAPAQKITRRIAEKHGFVRTGTRDGLEVYRRKNSF